MRDPETGLKYLTTEIVQRRPDGTEEVKYRATYGSKYAADLMKQVDNLHSRSGYFYRHITQ